MRFCCTASPAAARPRSTCGPSRKSSRQGKEALVLVPEISLTPQTIQRFRGRCGEVAVLHSHLRRCRARRPLAARRRRAGSGRRRRPQCRLRPDAQARPDRHRRGARNHLQAGTDAALPCPRRGRHAGPAGRTPDPARLGDAVAGKLAQRPARPVHAADAAAAGARSAAAARRPDRPAPRAASATAGCTRLSPSLERAMREALQARAAR